VHAGEDLDERRLARAVLADEGVRLTGIQRYRAFRERPDSAEALRGPVEHEPRVGRRVIS